MCCFFSGTLSEVELVPGAVNADVREPKQEKNELNPHHATKIIIRNRLKTF